MLFSLGLIVIFTAFRLAVIHAGLEREPGASLFGALSPIYFIQDIAAYLFFLALALLPGLIPMLRPRPLLRSLLGAVCFLIMGIAAIAAIRYYAAYEIHFQWSHMGGGSRELWASIRGEVDGTILLRFLMLLIFVGAWTWLASRMMPDGGPPGMRALLIAILFLPGLVLAIATGTSSTVPQDAETAGRYERSHNIPLRLLLPSPPAGSMNSANAGPNGTPGASGKQIVRREGPFDFNFPSASLADPKRLPRFPFPGKGKRRNVVLYIFESTSAEYIGRPVLYGPRRGKSATPIWDRLARNALNFRAHHAENPLSINALFTMLTSSYSMPADRWAATEFPNIKLEGIPEKLRRAGYRTGILHTGYFDYARQRAFLKRRRFDLMLDEKELRKPPYTKTLNWGIDDRAFLKPALKFARASREANKPFFMILQPVSPHHPYDIPDARFKSAEDRGKTTLRERWYARYLSSLHYSDYVLGRLVESMEKAGFGKDTLFVIVADHGEAFGRHRRNYNHPFYVYQENVHVPFLIYNRTLFPRPREFPHVSRHIDIAPTVLDLVGVPGDKRFQGRSLFRAGRPRMATFRATWRNDLQGLRDGKWKYIHNRRGGAQELYDLSRDPLEKENISAEFPALSARYRDYLRRLTNHQKRFFEHTTGKTINWNKKRDYE